MPGAYKGPPRDVVENVQREDGRYVGARLSCGHTVTFTRTQAKPSKRSACPSCIGTPSGRAAKATPPAPRPRASSGSRPHAAAPPPGAAAAAGKEAGVGFARLRELELKVEGLEAVRLAVRKVAVTHRSQILDPGAFNRVLEDLLRHAQRVGWLDPDPEAGRRYVQGDDEGGGGGVADQDGFRTIATRLVGKDRVEEALAPPPEDRRP